MKLDPNLELVSQVAALLDESIDPDQFDAALQQLDTNPALMESLMTVQFVKDAMQGNPCPDHRYTARIMQFIGKAEAQRTADDKSKK